MYTTSDWAGSCNRRFPSSKCDATDDVVVVSVPVGAVPLPSAELKGVQLLLLLLPSSGLRRMGDSSANEDTKVREKGKFLLFRVI